MVNAQYSLKRGAGGYGRIAIALTGDNSGTIFVVAKLAIILRNFPKATPGRLY